MSRPVIRLAQLPIPQPAKLAATGNVPLAAGCLAVALERSELAGAATIETVPTEATDELGDTLLADRLAAGEPAVLGLSLYLWNSERSLALARAVKRRSPRTRIVIGGPEVAPDNAWVLDPSAADAAVSGEAEEVAPAVFRALLEGGDPSGLPGVAAAADGRFSALAPSRAATFALDRFPSPYAAGALAVDPRRATYVETVRGCRSHCTFCFYPRSSAALRTLPIADSIALIRDLRERGAREIVFLDPTFNHRPDFDDLLEGLVDLNRDRRLWFFAEVRAEGLTERHADRFAAAGFTKLEIGLQSVNPVALQRSRRGGSKDLVAAAARMLKLRGIDLLVDLIIGLPGDRARDVAEGVRFLREHGLGEHAQVFPLSLLPGTAMRASAAVDGVAFSERPPYRVLRTPLFAEDEIAGALFAAEEELDRRLDELPRPFLCAAAAEGDAADVFEVDLDRAGAEDFLRAAAPGAQHAALWLRGTDLWAARAGVERAIAARLAVDPYATLDVVLAPRGPFPLDLIERARRLFRAAPESYAGRTAAHRGEDSARRVAVVLERGSAFAPDWIAAMRSLVPVYRDQAVEEALASAAHLGGDLPAARIVGPLRSPADACFRALAALADPDEVAFEDRALEARWVAEVLSDRE